MSNLTTRATKGSELTHNELDANFKRAAQTKAGAYTVAEGDNRDTIEVSATATITLPDVATIAAAADTGDFEVTIKNTGTGTVTVTCVTGTDTIDGSTADIKLLAQESETFKVNNAGNGYNRQNKTGPVYGLVMLDTPTALASVSGATDDTWQSYTGSELSALNAKIAIVYIYCTQDTPTVITSVGGEIHVRKNGSSVTNRPVARVFASGSSATSSMNVGAECLVELDASGHFDYKYDSHSNQNSSISVVLNGYYT